MRLYLLALNPTDSVTEGFLPAAARLGLDVTVLTEPRYEAAHRTAYEKAGRSVGRPAVSGCEVRDFREVVGRISREASGRTPFGVFSNSDHLQAQAALTAEYFGLPGKDWKAALRAKNKAETRRYLAAHGVRPVWSAELPPGDDPSAFADRPDVPYPCVVKPREGVASEDVVLARDPAELRKRAAEIRAARPEQALVVEEFLPGELHTLETLGDRYGTRHVLGGFHTELSPPPYFVEERMTFEPAAGQRPDVGEVLRQLDVLGVGFGACHTEFVVGEDGRARIVEVNYRAVGDQCDLLLAELLDIPLFDHILRAHLGERLPADLGARTDRRARQECPLADRAGTLTAAPDAAELTVDGVRLTYRPLRGTGERHELYHTNRDYLGVLRAIGTDQEAVDRAAAGFLAAQRWEITP
jgi:biotin carboxylase